MNKESHKQGQPVAFLGIVNHPIPVITYVTGAA